MSFKGYKHNGRMRSSTDKIAREYAEWRCNGDYVKADYSVADENGNYFRPMTFEVWANPEPREPEGKLAIPKECTPRPDSPFKRAKRVPEIVVLRKKIIKPL